MSSPSGWRPAPASDAGDLTWEVESGDWTVVIMNADASPGVDTDARLGIKVGWFLPATIALLAGGLVLLLGGTALAIIAGRGLARAPAEPVAVTGPAPFPPPAVPGAPAATAAAAGIPGVASVPSPAPHYPLTITGHLDDELSRGLWLVKWLLAIPHYIVLAFLWLAFLVVTIIAFFAILFTKRYPRACSTSTSGCSGGAGGSASTRSARSARTATRPSR